uniref:Peptidase M3 n=1 Tax=Eiseniibacteriota bacterium TaxID=2212470 RepID=A0A832I7G9_UNCEI
MSRTRSLPLAALLAAALLSGPSAAASPARGASDPPFWTGRETPASFRRQHEGNLARARAAIARLKAVQGRRTVQNTLVPYDEASRLLDLSGSQASLIENVHPDSALRAAAEGVSQAVAGYATEISLDRGVYDALAALDLSGADAETRFYVERELRNFRLAGVDRDDATRARIRALRDSLVKVGQDWLRHIREDVRTVRVKPSELAGMPQDFLDAHPPGADGLVTLDINYPDYLPVMTYCPDASVRRRLFMEFQNRAYPRNVAVLRTMMSLRHELATALGFSNWADCVTADKMAGNAKTVRDFIDRIVAASEAAQARDYRQLLERKRRDVPGAERVELFEQPYWAELVKRSAYGFDSQEIRPYLPYRQVKQGMLDLTSRLFGVTYRQVKDAPVWHPSVECWELLEDGRVIGRFYLDMHPRENKYNHAAQFGIRSGVAGKHLPEAALVCNLPGGAPDDPGLCGIDDVETFLHEFGHLLHTLFAGKRAWTGTSGIRTEHDFVEAPSQLLEELLKDPGVLQTFARHHQTGAPVPADLVRRMIRAEEFAKGLQVRRQMVYADLSLSIYDRAPEAVDLDALARGLVERYQPFPYPEGTHFYTSFGHLDGYSAVYYTYMWSLVIAKDLFSAFDHDDLLNPAPAMKYRRAVLEAGGSAPAATLVERFLGRPFSFDAYRAWLDRTE